MDIAGLVKGASAGEGLGNQFLSNIREVDAIAEVVRLFEDPNIIHVDGKVDPTSDIDVINLELILADMQTVSKRLANIERDVKRGDKDAVAEKNALAKINAGLEAGNLASSIVLDENELVAVRGMHLLTMKPILYVLNKKAGARNLDKYQSDGGDERWQKLKQFLDEKKCQYVFVDAGVENELSSFDGDEKETFRKRARRIG